MDYWIFGIIIFVAIGIVIFGVYNLSKGASVVTYVSGLPQEKSGWLSLLELNDDSVRVKNLQYKTEGTIPFSLITKSEVIHHKKLAEKQEVLNNAIVGEILLGGLDPLVGATSGKKVTEDHYFLSIDYIDKDGNYENALFLPNERMSFDKYSGLTQVENFSEKLNVKIGCVNN